MDDAIEVFGAKGQTYADMLMGNALPTYSEAGLGRKIALPFRPHGISKPIDLWKKPELASLRA